VSSAFFVRANGNREDHRGIVPDIEVRRTVEDIRRGSDPVLERAKRWILGQDALGSLSDGIYYVVREDSAERETRSGGNDFPVLPYTARYSDSGPEEPARYITLDPSSFIPMILEGAPDMQKDSGGKTLLGVTLKERYARPLEEFTRKHLGGKVAILLGGEIITIHKVRSVISGGRIQITRCDDNACEVLRSKLEK